QGTEIFCRVEGFERRLYLEELALMPHSVAQNPQRQLDEMVGVLGLAQCCNDSRIHDIDETTLVLHSDEIGLDDGIERTKSSIPKSRIFGVFFEIFERR